MAFLFSVLFLSICSPLVPTQYLDVAKKLRTCSGVRFTDITVQLSIPMVTYHRFLHMDSNIRPFVVCLQTSSASLLVSEVLSVFTEFTYDVLD